MVGNLNSENVSKWFPGYTFISQFPESGFKIVAKCSHATHGCVVIKIIPKATFDRSRFEREVLASTKLRAQRIPELLESGERELDSPHYYIVERHIEGLNLAEAAKNGPVPLCEVFQYCQGCLEVLQAAEAERIVHRDLKPDNIISTTNGVFILDFGISRHLDMDALTGESQLTGPAAIGYAPPEQMYNQQDLIDSRTDLFALGVSMWELGLGRHPFRHGKVSNQEVALAVKNDDPPPLGHSCEWEEKFIDLLSCMVQKKPQARPNTITHALEWLLESPPK